MSQYQLFILDDRYRVPTLVMVELADDEGVIAFARKRLGESPHHLSIEIRSDERIVARIEQPRPDEG